MADIVSPIPGIFYVAPAPDKPPFVSPGDTVEVGQTVGMVEIMKQFNDIKSDVSGTVESVEVENAAPVTPGMVLVKVSEG